MSLIFGFAVTVAIWPREVVSCRDFILRAVATFWAMSLVGIDPGRASFNIQDDRSTRGLLAKPLKFPKSLIRPAGSHFWLPPNLQWELSVWMNINRVTLQHNKELIMFVFYLMILKRCVIFKSFLSTPASDVHERPKTTGTAIKIARETTNDQ